MSSNRKRPLDSILYSGLSSDEATESDATAHLGAGDAGFDPPASKIRKTNDNNSTVIDLDSSDERTSATEAIFGADALAEQILPPQSEYTESELAKNYCTIAKDLVDWSKGNYSQIIEFARSKLVAQQAAVAAAAEATAASATVNCKKPEAPSFPRDADTIILCGDQLTHDRDKGAIVCHKFILMYMSEYFRAMLSGVWPEAQQDAPHVITYPTISINAMETMLVFIYSGVMLPMQKHDFLSCVVAADVMYVRSALLFLDRMLLPFVTTDNALHVINAISPHIRSECIVRACDLFGPWSSEYFCKPGEVSAARVHDLFKLSPWGMTTLLNGLKYSCVGEDSIFWTAMIWCSKKCGKPWTYRESTELLRSYFEKHCLSCIRVQCIHPEFIRDYGEKYGVMSERSLLRYYRLFALGDYSVESLYTFQRDGYITLYFTVPRDLSSNALLGKFTTVINSIQVEARLAFLITSSDGSAYPRFVFDVELGDYQKKKLPAAPVFLSAKIIPAAKVFDQSCCFVKGIGGRIITEAIPLETMKSKYLSKNNVFSVRIFASSALVYSV